MLIFYRHSREINRFLSSNQSISRTSYFRILVLVSIDVVLTLPFSLVSLALVTSHLPNNGSVFYPGWVVVHSNWRPVSLPGGVSGLSQLRVGLWIEPITSFAIFGLFGLTASARASYREVFDKIRGTLGKRATLREQSETRSIPSTIEFATDEASISTPNLGAFVT